MHELAGGMLAMIIFVSQRGRDGQLLQMRFYQSLWWFRLSGEVYHLVNQGE